MEDQAVEQGVVVVTGGIGSGKSTVAGMFRELGAVVVSADAVAREVVQPGSPVLAQLVAEFGVEVILPDGTLDRRRLAEIVFGDPGRRKVLEQITHPAIRQRSRELFMAAAARCAPLIIYECPLFFETELAAMRWKHVVVVSAPLDAVKARVMRRDDVTPAEVEARLRSQLPPEEKLTRADTVIENSGSLEMLRSRVEEVYHELTAHKS